MRGGLAGLSEWLQGTLLKGFDAVVAVSSPLARELTERGLSPDRVHLIPNSPSTTVAPLPRQAARVHLGLGETDTPVIGWVGRLIPVKGGEVFLRALAALSGDRWTGSMIGDGPERGVLERLANDLGIGNRVRFHGSMPEAAKYQSAFDLFVLSSHSEGIPMVVFEAAAAGTPIVATAVGGIPDVLSGREAHLVGAGDVDALAGAIRASLDDLEGARERAVRARERIVAEFSEEVWMDRYERLYRELETTRR
jgi:glycosyltransferase involved in cell wall biosynthesis